MTDVNEIQRALHHAYQRALKAAMKAGEHEKIAAAALFAHESGAAPGTSEWFATAYNHLAAH